MTKTLAKLRRLALRRFWDEDREEASRRRRRLFLGLPFAALAGLVWGSSAASSMGAGSAPFWSLFGAVT